MLQPRPNFPSWYFPKVRKSSRVDAVTVWGGVGDFNGQVTSGFVSVWNRNLHQQHLGHDVQEGKFWNWRDNLPSLNQGTANGWDCVWFWYIYIFVFGVYCVENVLMLPSKSNLKLNLRSYSCPLPCELIYLKTVLNLMQCPFLYCVAFAVTQQFSYLQKVTTFLIAIFFILLICWHWKKAT